VSFIVSAEVKENNFDFSKLSSHNMDEKIRERDALTDTEDGGVIKVHYKTVLKFYFKILQHNLVDLHCDLAIICSPKNFFHWLFYQETIHQENIVASIKLFVAYDYILVFVADVL